MLNRVHNTVAKEFFCGDISKSDPDVFAAISREGMRQQHEIELIASENMVSNAVMSAQGSLMTNKYAEGYPGRRYYGGCEHVDVVEELARNRARQLFDCAYVNVQPHSGSQANQAVFFTLMEPGDTYLGLNLSAGGHLTHGSPVNQSGKWFNAVSYGVDRETHLIDYDEVERLAHEHRPKLILAGGSAYPRQIDFARFRKIADSVNAKLFVDMAHFAGLVAGGLHPSPLPWADVVTTTTHKTLRGPRGGMILSKDEDLGKRINSAVFPGLQGGPLMHVIAAKAVAFGEALKPGFRNYTQAVLDNAHVLAETLKGRGLDIVSGGTDTHLVLVDLRPKGVTGKTAEEVLGRHNMTCNKNGIPFDPESPMITSGIRLGTPASTTRGFGTGEFRAIGNLIGDVLDSCTHNPDRSALQIQEHVLDQVKELTEAFPTY